MDYINSIINHLIIIVSLITFIGTAISLFFDLIKKPLSIKNYYMSNIFYTIICSISYISFFIIFFYCLRISNVSTILDLKIYFKYFQLFKNIFSGFSFSFKLYLSASFIILFINIILLINLLQKYFVDQIFKLYLFARHNPKERDDFTLFFSNHIRSAFDCDIFSYYLQEISGYIEKRVFYYTNNLSWKSSNIVLSDEWYKARALYMSYIKKKPWYQYHTLIIRIVNHKYYKKYLIPSSPLFVLLYDCIFNNFVLSHIYYYLLLYVPLMLWRRITTYLFVENDDISGLIWDILYKDETCIYALPLNHKKLFEVYIANGIKTIPIPGCAELDLHVSMYMKQAATFIYDLQENCYKNSEHGEIHDSIKDKLVNDMIKVTIWEDGNEHYEEWCIIAIKDDSKHVLHNNTEES